ncbi:peroxiredoxin family protein [Akkermansiaceae bacterium]|nr:peroxiredoxin family protein [Akkermansiaceae bacterium]
MALLIGVVFGDGVAEANKLISQSRQNDVEAMTVLDLVAGNLKEEGVPQVIEWVIENGYAQERKKVGDLIWSLPKNDQLMVKYVQILSFYGEREQLEAVIKKLPNGNVNQKARFRLALLVAEDAQRDLTLTDTQRAKENQTVVSILDKLREEDDLDELLQRWIKDLKYKVTHLVVGCEAPEIEGFDQDGKKFCLSDYRGKVVLLPFWGIW